MLSELPRLRQLEVADWGDRAGDTTIKRLLRSPLPPRLTALDLFYNPSVKTIETFMQAESLRGLRRLGFHANGGLAAKEPGPGFVGVQGLTPDGLRAIAQTPMPES